MNASAQRRLDIVAAIGLALGAVFGLAGTIVAQPQLQATLWAIDSVGLVTVSALLAVKFLRKGCDFVAAGFLVFALGESVMLSGTAAGLVGSMPSFAAGTALWAAALLLISIPREFAAVQYCVIAREERYLERKFGAEYLGYKARVRRWL